MSTFVIPISFEVGYLVEHDLHLAPKFVPDLVKISMLPLVELTIRT